MPTLAERVWLVDTTRFSPSIDTTVFDPAAPVTSLWTTTPFAIDGTRAWTITTTAGRTGFEFIATASAIPWCVRGTATPPPAVFVDNADGTVTDANAGLMWQKATSTGIDYFTAQSYCSTLSLGGHSGWRVPTVEETFRLGRYDLDSPALDTTIFTASGSGVIWSSTPFAQITGDQWIWSEMYGESVNSPNGSTLPVRCVR